jgi:hypothetical protein
MHSGRRLLVFVTAGITALSPDHQVEIMRRVHAFAAFTPAMIPRASTPSAPSIPRARPSSGKSIATSRTWNMYAALFAIVHGRFAARWNV